MPSIGINALSYTTLFRSNPRAAVDRGAHRDVRRTALLADFLGHADLEERALEDAGRSEEHTSELQSHHELVCRLLLEKKKAEPYDRHEYGTAKDGTPVRW